MALKVKKLKWNDAHEGMWLRAEPRFPVGTPVYEISPLGYDAKSIERAKAKYQKEFDRWVLAMKRAIDDLIEDDGIA